MSSFYGSAMRRYTSFKSSKSPTSQILCHDKYVISLSARSVKLNNRRGLLKNAYNDETFKSLSCMQLGKDTHELILGGNEDQILKLNFDTGNVSKVC